MATNKRDGGPRLLPFLEGCKYGGFSRSKAYQLIRQRKIIGVKMDRRTMLDRASIDRYHNSLPSITLDDAAQAAP